MKSNQTPANKRVVPTKKKTTTVKSKHAPKQLEEKFAIKHEIAVRLRRGQSRNQVAESMIKDGIDVSTPTVYAYARQIHDEWVKFKNESYDLHVSRQLAMLDEMIAECWSMLNKSKELDVKTTSEFGFIYPEDAEEKDEEDPSDETRTLESKSKGRTKIRRVEKRQTSEKIEKASRDGDIEVLKMLERFWVRRCEILGISSSTTINIQNNNQYNETHVNKPVSNQFFRSVVIQEDVRKGIQEADAEIIEDNQNDE